MSIWNKVFGSESEKAIKKVTPLLTKVNSLEPEMEKLSDSDLAAKTGEFRRQLENGKTLDDILPEAFAVVREVGRRALKMRHFDAQIIGGIMLHQGKIAEMKTGEGKTLVATLPVYLNALAGKGVHVVTVNEYLAQRDAEWMGKIYQFLGLSVGVTLHGQSGEEKKAAYEADITYGTNNEFGFDYLRDNMVPELSRMAQRGLVYAIVDEVDSILIDEARTPLIISAPAEESTDKYYQFSKLVRELKENEDYNVDEKLKAATLTEEGISHVEKLLRVGNIYEEKGIETVHHLEQALRAWTLFQRDRDYVVKDGQVVIVDEFTGRLMEGRRFSEGLHQALEAKEGVEIKRESRTLATITFQNYFRMYQKLAGMTGTAETEEEEFRKIYGLEVMVIPTHKPMVREDLNDKIYKTELGKFKAVARDVKARYEKGQPVLIGTVSIEKNERLAALLKSEGVPHEVLNAKQHEKEAMIIAQAGKMGSVTVATNMAGRGVDIVLGGNPSDPEEAKTIKDLGGLAVIGTERHESRRIDNQLRGRAGRQGDPGSSQFYISMEDDLLRLFGSDRMKSIMEMMKVPEDQPIEHRIISRSIETAQKKVEGNNFDIRKHVVEFDDVINKHREVIYRRRRAVLEAWEQSKPILIGEEKPAEESTLKAKPLSEQIRKMIEAEIELVVSRHSSEEGEEWNIEEIVETTRTIFPAPPDLRERLESLVGRSGAGKDSLDARTKVIEELTSLARQAYEAKEKALGEEMMRGVERAVMLRTIDANWVNHLDAMTSLREGIGLRGYGQRDPLVEYKKEGFAMFERLLADIQKGVVYTVYKVGVVSRQKSPMESSNILTNSGKGPEKQSSRQIKKKEDEVGRNDPCPCGSGKKYKKCCGK